jgi:hypothetical protein
MRMRKIYIQSKSGNFNTEFNTIEEPLCDILGDLRQRGGYYAEYRKNMVYVPFEEIQYISEAE